MERTAEGQPEFVAALRDPRARVACAVERMAQALERIADAFEYEPPAHDTQPAEARWEGTD